MYWTPPTPSCRVGLKLLRSRNGESKLERKPFTAAMKLLEFSTPCVPATPACRNHTPSHADRANSDALGFVTLTPVSFMIFWQSLKAGSGFVVQVENDEPWQVWSENQLTALAPCSCWSLQ